MTGISNKFSFVSLSMVVALLLVADAARANFLFEEEGFELERQLKAINKPAIKSFWTKHGDILDCVEIHKQLAFDHPLLKNHTIQMKPTTIPEWITRRDSRNVDSQPFLLKHIKCPKGTVMIKRTTKKDLMNAKLMKSLGFDHTRSSGYRSNNVDFVHHHSAVAESKGSSFGAKGNINVWEPYVEKGQFSLAGLWLVNGPLIQKNSINAGWLVNKVISNFSCLYAFWTADNYDQTGCLNTMCPGFVQLSSIYALGARLFKSAYGGQQQELDLSIYQLDPKLFMDCTGDILKIYLPKQDRHTGNWWLVVKDVYVGYWPKDLFTSPGLVDGASFVSWGGEVYSPKTQKSPAMGSGQFPGRGFRRSAYVNGIKLIDGLGRVYDPERNDLKTYADHPKCYNVMTYFGEVEPWLTAIYYGGPGKCTF